MSGRVIHVIGDGNCLFRFLFCFLYLRFLISSSAIALGLQLGPTGHVLLRTAAANYIETNRQHFEGFLDTEEAFDEYLLNLRRDEHYAGETAIQALVERF